MDDFTETIRVEIPSDAEGYTGRECPVEECRRYFKVKGGTGLPGPAPCVCPYCGHTGPPDEFYTEAQIEYAQSIAMNRASARILRDLKKLEVRPDPRAFISIGVTVRGSPHPIAHYREHELEQKVVCDSCGLHYAIYGAFGFCPDCGKHNSIQIFLANLDVVLRLLDLAGAAPQELSVRLVENALEDAVSTFDGFAREICSVHAERANNPQRASKIAFQNLERAAAAALELFSIDLAQSLEATRWRDLLKAFQKRHLIAHKMKVIDQEYLARTGEPSYLLGRQVTISPEEVRSVVESLRDLSLSLGRGFGIQPPTDAARAAP